MVLGPRPRNGLARHQHHIVAIGEDVRQRREFFSLDDEVFQSADSGLGKGRTQLTGENALDGAFDLEIEGFAVPGHEIDGFPVVIEKNGAES